MTDFTFSETAVPVVTRDKAPNPFDGKFPTVEGKAISLTIKGGLEANADLIGKLERQARAAGNALETPVTVRTVKVENGTGKAAESVLTFWSTSKVSRPRGPKAE